MTKRYLISVYSDGTDKEGPFSLDKDRLAQAAKISNDGNEELVIILFLDVYEDFSVSIVEFFAEKELNG